MASRGHSPPPPTPGRFPETAEPGVAERAHVPLHSEGGGEGLGAQKSARGLGTPRAGSEGERTAESWFPRSPRAPHSRSRQVSSQFCQRRGAVLAPGSASERHWRLQRARKAVRGGKNGRRERYWDAAPPAHSPLPPAAPVGGT